MGSWFKYAPKWSVFFLELLRSLREGRKSTERRSYCMPRWACRRRLHGLMYQICPILGHIFFELLRFPRKRHKSTERHIQSRQRWPERLSRLVQELQGHERQRAAGVRRGKRHGCISFKRMKKKVVEGPTRYWPGKPDCLGGAVPTLIIAEGTMCMA